MVKPHTIKPPPPIQSHDPHRCTFFSLSLSKIASYRFRFSDNPRSDGYQTMRHENDGLAVWRVQVPRKHHERVYFDVRFRRMQFGSEPKARRRVTNRSSCSDTSADCVLRRPSRRMLSTDLGRAVSTRKFGSHKSHDKQIG